MLVQSAKQARVERAIQELRLLNRLLSSVLLALSARALIDGLSVASAITCALFGLLLAMSMALVRGGRRLVLAPAPEPIPNDQGLEPWPRQRLRAMWAHLKV